MEKEDNAMKITYWSDYACPYCYIGKARLKKAISEVKAVPEYRGTEFEVEMKAFQLDPTAGEHATGDTQTRFANKYGISMEEAGETIEHISQMGRDEGLDFKYATTLFTNTMDAHRLTKLAQSKDSEISEKVVEALYKAYFTENKELADKELLRKIGVDCGLDEVDVEEVLSSEKFRDEVILDEREASRYGIHAVPFFVIGKNGVSGAQSVNGMKAAIINALGNNKADKAAGISCGPEGCRIR